QRAPARCAALEPRLGPVPQRRRGRCPGAVADRRRRTPEGTFVAAADPGAGPVAARPPRGSRALVCRRGPHRAAAVAVAGPRPPAAGLDRSRPRRAGRSRRGLAGRAARLALIGRGGPAATL